MARPKEASSRQESPVNLRGTWTSSRRWILGTGSASSDALVAAILLMLLPAYWIATAPDPPRNAYQDNIIVSKGSTKELRAR